MRYRPFGRTGLSVSEVGVGCSRIGGVFAAGSSRRDELDMLRGAIDGGINFFDTSDLYSQGDSEVLIGKAIKHRRAEIVVATKGGYVVPSRSRWLGRARPLLRPMVQALRLKKPGGPPGPPEALEQDFSPVYLTAAVEASLRRLGTDYIDVYQLHSPPADVVAAGEFVSVLEHLQQQGKIRHFGVAVDSAADAIGFERHPAIETVQLPFSAVDRDAARAVFPAAARTGAAVIARSCFAAGYLVGAHPEAELRALTAHWEAIVEARATAAQLGRPLKELALQFSLAADAVAVTIVGMRIPAQLAEVLRLAAAPPLAADEIAAVRGGRRS